MTTSAQVAKPAVKAVTKAASKPVSPKAAPAKKAAPKAAAKPAKAKGELKYSLVAGVARPVSGSLLHAHTQAVFELTGLDKGAAVEKATLRKVMGDTALRYNINEGKFAVADGKVSLTAAGQAMIASRAAKIDSALVDAYKEVMTTGKPVESVCKNKDAIVAIA